ncbi:MAG: S8 family serine peptidase, partial [Lachnospiraceae bacterium]|nr:S8 family serine peptidase [Lachnospiraceae bacterium]
MLKKRTLYRIWAIALAVALVFGLIPTAALAADTGSVGDTVLAAPPSADPAESDTSAVGEGLAPPADPSADDPAEGDTSAVGEGLAPPADPSAADPAEGDTSAVGEGLAPPADPSADDPAEDDTSAVGEGLAPPADPDGGGDDDAPYALDRVIVKLASRPPGTMGIQSAVAGLPDFGLDLVGSRLLNPAKEAETVFFSANSVNNPQYGNQDDIQDEISNDTQNNMYVLTLAETGVQAVEEALELLNANPLVEYAEPDYYMQLYETPNDPDLGQQWALAKIRAAQAWDITTGSKDVVVGIIDTGINGTHPDLVNNLWTNPIPGRYGHVNDWNGYNFYDRRGGAPYDTGDHGTHVAGIVGAKGNNGIGVSGINWNVSLAWLGVASNENMMQSSAIVEALNYANNHNIPITNNSYGSNYYSNAMYSAIRSYNGLFVAAAGNNASDNDAIPHYPSGYNLPNIIAVASTDSTDNLSYFSNYGQNTVHIAAPGSNIRSTLPNSQYGNASGTSMATPYVAGVAALVLTAHPEYNTAQLREAILSSARAVPALNAYNLKIVDAYAAVTAAVTPYYHVTYDYNDEATSPRTVLMSSTLLVPCPTDPVRDGYLFCGWYTAAVGGELYDFASPLVGPLVLYARWSTSSEGTFAAAFPDAAFRNNVLSRLRGEGIYRFAGSLVDTVAEAALASFSVLAISNKGIADLSGIAYFTGLTSLNCSNNNLTELDVSANPALTSLNCSNNNLTELDVSANTALTALDCRSNNIASPSAVAGWRDEDGFLFSPQKWALTSLQTQINAYAAAIEDITVYVYEDAFITRNLSVPGNPNGKTLTIKSFAPENPFVLRRSFTDVNSSTGLLTIASGAKLILEDIIVDGDKENFAENKAPLVRISNGGALTMKDGVVLRNNVAQTYGGVYNLGTFTMTGGEVSGNAGSYGGGVYNSSGTFTMTGGEISGNAGNYGGGVYNSSGTFTMTDGAISGNTSDYGGGACNSGAGTFTMTGGAISGNTSDYGGGVYNYSFDTFTLGGTAKIKDNTDDNLYLNSGQYVALATGLNAPAPGMEIWVRTQSANGIIVAEGAAAGQEAFFHISDIAREVIHDNGQIKIAVRTDAIPVTDFPTLKAIVNAFNTGNADMTALISASFPLGSSIFDYLAVYNNNGKALTIKSDNQTRTLTRGYSDPNATSGLFVVSSGRLVLEDIVLDGAKDTYGDNNAPLVYVGGNGVFTMKESAVLQNNQGRGVDNAGTFIMSGGAIRGNASSNIGGGVYSSGTFAMTGGEISGNTAAGSGSGVYLGYGTFTLGGTAKIKDNADGNLYLAYGQYVTLGTEPNAPASGMEIWVQAAGGVIVNSGAAAGQELYFHINDIAREVIHDSGQIRIAARNVFTATDFSMLKSTVALFNTENVDITVLIGADFALGSSTADRLFVSNVNGKTLTIKGEGQAYTLTRGYSDSGVAGGLFYVSRGGLVLEDIVIDGAKETYTDNDSPLVNISSSGVFTMKEGAALRNNYGRGVYNSSSGVYNSGTFTMAGGKISGNIASSGGGVYSPGTFTMTGGEISGNSSSYGGGVYNSGTFAMTGGEISGNTSIGSGSGVYFGSGTLTLGGTAKIKDNIGSNLYLSSGRYVTLGTGANVPAPDMEIWVQTQTASGVIVNEGAAAGQELYFHINDMAREVIHDSGQLRLAVRNVFTATDFSMLKTTVDLFNTENVDMTVLIGADFALGSSTADQLVINNLRGKTLTIKGEGQAYTLTRGYSDSSIAGGLFVVNNGGLVLGDIVLDGVKETYTSNSAPIVYVGNNGVFAMKEGTVLQNNNSYFGGVYNYSGTFTMTGGVISGNIASYLGGGVVCGSYGSFTMTGGEISGNNAAGHSNGGGVYVASGSGTLALGGSAKIKNNTGYNLHLSDGCYVTLGTGANAPAEGMEIWVQTGAPSGVIASSGAVPGQEAYFQADEASMIVAYSYGQLIIQPYTDPVPISLTAIPGLAPPAKGAVPVSAISETDEYTGTVAWSPALADDGTFAAETVYTATVTLMPKAGFTVEGLAADCFTVTGAEATNAADSGVITAVFPATEAKEPDDPGNGDGDGDGDDDEPTAPQPSRLAITPGYVLTEKNKTVALTVSPAPGHAALTDIAWYLDGQLIAGSGGKETIELTPGAAGTHAVSAMLTTASGRTVLAAYAQVRVHEPEAGFAATLLAGKVTVNRIANRGALLPLRLSRATDVSTPIKLTDAKGAELANFTAELLPDQKTVEIKIKPGANPKSASKVTVWVGEEKAQGQNGQDMTIAIAVAASYPKITLLAESLDLYEAARPAAIFAAASDGTEVALGNIEIIGGNRAADVTVVNNRLQLKPGAAKTGSVKVRVTLASTEYGSLSKKGNTFTTTVKIGNSEPKVKAPSKAGTLAAKGKIDVVNPQSAIAVKISAADAAANPISAGNVALIGPNGAVSPQYAAEFVDAQTFLIKAIPGGGAAPGVKTALTVEIGGKRYAKTVNVTPARSATKAFQSKKALTLYKDRPALGEDLTIGLATPNNVKLGEVTLDPQFNG